jgi:Domain of unknown function (DUF3854)
MSGHDNPTQGQPSPTPAVPPSSQTHSTVNGSGAASDNGPTADSPAPTSGLAQTPPPTTARGPQKPPSGTQGLKSLKGSHAANGANSVNGANSHDDDDINGDGDGDDDEDFESAYTRTSTSAHTSKPRMAHVLPDAPSVNAAQKALLRATRIAQEDLQKSGLDLRDMGIENVTAQIAAELGIPYGLFQDGVLSGYTLPYYNVVGQKVPFYRVRLFLGGDDSAESAIKHHVGSRSPSFVQLIRRFPNFPEIPKYLQPGRSSTFVYFPKGFGHAVVKGKQILKAASPEVKRQITKSMSSIAHLSASALKHDECRGYIIITEGEKKAAAATKAGFPTVGLGGVDNWRATRIVLPEGTIVQQQLSGRSHLDDNDGDIPGRKPPGKAGKLTIKLPKTAQRRGEGSIEDDSSTLAVGLEDIIHLAIHEDFAIVICYDSDAQSPNDPNTPNALLSGNLKPEVQRASSALAYELRYRGLRSDRIKQLILPLAAEDFNDPLNTGTDGQLDIQPKKRKMGLDDFLVKYGSEAFEDLLRECLLNPHSFPRHPNPKAVVNRALETPFLYRKGMQQVASAILAELDARGSRFMDSNSEEPYYFDNTTCTLMPAPLDKGNTPFHETRFGRLLYQQYGISRYDKMLMPWLASQFTGELPIGTCVPRSVMFVDKEAPNLQLGDSFFVTVNEDPNEPITIKTNGSDGMMFVSGAVEPVDVHLFAEEFDKQYAKYCQTGKFENWWLEPLRQANITLPAQKDLANLLFYISPFLNRWRGLQLPIELYYGEPNSGKSSLASLRLLITTGRSTLRNMSQDIRDWYASITSTGGLYLVDNANFRNPEMRQTLSDESCRIITTQDPTVELRRLYTTATVQRLPVTTVFAYTAITPQFKALDFLQRSVIFEFFALPPEAHDSDWVERHLKSHGSREAWIANHCLFLHLFRRAASNEGLDGTGNNLWLHPLEAQHRLAHFERCLYVAANILHKGETKATTVKAYMSTIHKNLQQQQEDMQVSTDWVLEGLREFALNWPLNKPFTASNIVDFCDTHEAESVQKNSVLTDVRRLSRYLSSNRGNLLNITNIAYAGMKNQRQTYIIAKRPRSPTNRDLSPQHTYPDDAAMQSDTIDMSEVHVSSFHQDQDIADDDTGDP